MSDEGTNQITNEPKVEDVTGGTEPTKTPEGQEPKVDEGTQQQTPKQEPAKLDISDFFGAPEGEYEKVQMPEGIEFDEEGHGELVKLAKEKGLSQTAVTSLENMMAGRIQQAQKNAQQAWSDHIKAQEELCKKDSVIGGPNYEKSTAIINEGLKKFAGEDVTAITALLSNTGVSYDPAVRRFLYNVGQSVMPDTLGGGEGVKTGNEDNSTQGIAKRMFPESLKE